jgi:peptidyl-prolyl cis-trans isomerase B (cyclophilin B)
MRDSMRPLRVLLAGLLLVLAVAASGCGGGDGHSGGAETADCRDVEAPAPRDPEQLEPPSARLDEGTTYGLRFETSCGAFTMTLRPGLAPKTTASLVSLAEQGYFDDTIFHRIVPGFVVQGGDPTQSGGGGPGYTTVDPPPQDVRYTKGVVAMAKTADEPAGTSGSQFFVVTAEDAGLPPDYAVVGEVDDGLDVVERIGALGDETELPTQTVLVDSVTVVES